MNPSERPFRVAVIGCGAQGSNHLAAYRTLPDVAIAAVCDLDPGRLEAASREVPSARAFPDYRDLLAAVPVDLVSVCTMPVSHREVVTAALTAGTHVLCEKPMALDATEAEAMVAAARASRRVLTLGYNMRWMGSAQFARRYVAEGRLGRPQYARVYALANDIPWWGMHYVRAVSGGGALASTAVHVLDLLLWVIGHPDPLAVSATMLRRFPERRGDTSPTAEARTAYDVEDLVSAHIRLAGGLAVTLEAAWAYDAPRSHYSFDLTGGRARLQFDPLMVIHEADGRPVDQTPVGVAETDWPASVRREIGDVVGSLRSGRPPLVTAEQALALQHLTDALYRSAAEGREVRL